jgi:hypothetical protein
VPIAVVAFVSFAVALDGVSLSIYTAAAAAVGDGATVAAVVTVDAGSVSVF